MSNPQSLTETAHPAVICRPAAAEELRPALAIILGTDGRAASHAQVADFIQFAKKRSIDLSALWVAETAGKMIWSALPVLSPGRTMLLFSPSRLANPEAASQLVAHICDFCAGRDVHLAQVLIDPEHGEARQFFFVHGFAEIAELIYLQVHVPRFFKAPELTPSRRWLAYSPDKQAIFAEAILASYRQSLDCPALAGLREIDDVIAGHKATGEHDPALWELILEEDQAQGVLLLSRIPDADALELVYVGLCPEARGRGLGTLLVRRAMYRVAADNRRKLTLAVDSNNAPALKLYYRHGMQRLGSRIAMIRDLRPAK